MIKIFLTILAVYMLYYAGNIAYDLFLKKDSSQQEEEGEEYSLTEFNGNNTAIQEVTIDDVEHLNTPSSFITREPISSMQENPDEPHDLEDWRRKFESEQDIDAFEAYPQIEEQLTEREEVPEDDPAEFENIQDGEKGAFSDPNPTSDIDTNVDLEQENESPSLKLKQQFYQFLSLAETQVQVLADRDGFKVYHSIT